MLAYENKTIRIQYPSYSVHDRTAIILYFNLYRIYEFVWPIDRELVRISSSRYQKAIDSIEKFK